MFTGIITDIGELVTCREGRFAIRCSYPATGIAVGASIACDGACLTATEIGAVDGISLTVNAVEKNRFGINIVPHTLTHTTLGAKKPGDRVNLEADVFARYVVRAMELRT